MNRNDAVALVSLVACLVRLAYAPNPWAALGVVAALVSLFAGEVLRARIAQQTEDRADRRKALEPASDAALKAITERQEALDSRLSALEMERMGR